MTQGISYSYEYQLVSALTRYTILILPIVIGVTYGLYLWAKHFPLTFVLFLVVPLAAFQLFWYLGKHIDYQGVD